MGITARTLASIIGGRRSLSIVDSRVRADLPGDVGAVSVEVLDAERVGVRDVLRLASRIRACRAEVVVGVGGGAVLDAVKLAALPPALLEYAIAGASQCAVTTLPARTSDTPDIEVVAAATTIGTASESSAVAMLSTERGFRLVVGAQLRPRWVVLDGALLMSLPQRAVRAGCFEAFARLAGVNTRPRGADRARAQSIGLARALLETGDDVADGPGHRLRAARLSVAAQRSAALRGRDPYAPRHWYVANEVSFALGVSRIEASASILGSVWSAILRGDLRWGDADPLSAFWAESTASLDLARPPSEGIDELVRRWRIPLAARPGDDRRAHTAQRVVDCWGGRLPMLDQLDVPDVDAVLRGANWSSGEARVARAHESAPRSRARAAPPRKGMCP